MRIEWMEKYLKEAEQMIYNQNLEEGLGLLNKLLYEEPGYGSLHNHIGWAYCYYTEEAERAERHLKLAAKFDPDYAAPYLHLGNLYTRLRRYGEALTWFEAGLNLSTANKTIMLEGMAKAYELKMDYARAISYYKRALASTLGAEVAALNESIKRCRKKRFVLLFNF